MLDATLGDSISVKASVHGCAISVLTHNFVWGKRDEAWLNGNEARGICKACRQGKIDSQNGGQIHKLLSWKV